MFPAVRTVQQMLLRGFSFSSGTTCLLILIFPGADEIKTIPRVNVVLKNKITHFGGGFLEEFGKKLPIRFLEGAIGGRVLEKTVKINRH